MYYGGYTEIENTNAHHQTSADILAALKRISTNVEEVQKISVWMFTQERR